MHVSTFRDGDAVAHWWCTWGPRFESGISHNDPDALLDHCILYNNVENLREGNYPWGKNFFFSFKKNIPSTPSWSFRCTYMASFNKPKLRSRSFLVSLLLRIIAIPSGLAPNQQFCSMASIVLLLFKTSRFKKVETWQSWLTWTLRYFRHPSLPTNHCKYIVWCARSRCEVATRIWNQLQNNLDKEAET